MCATYAVIGSVVSATMAHAEFSLTILHVNDVHARLQPISRVNGTREARDNADGNCFGSMARVPGSSYRGSDARVSQM